MAIRLSGMVSGLDTDAIVKELVSAYSKKTESYEKDKTKLEWKQEIWKDLNTKIYDLYSRTLGTLRFSSAYNKKKTSISDESKATITASANAAKGTQSMEIHKVATSGYLTGSRLDIYGLKDLSAKTNLRELGIVDETSISIQVGKGDIQTITMSGDTTVGDLVKQLNEAGINANFDEENKRFFLTSTDTGKENDFKLSGDSDALQKLGILSEDYSYGTEEMWKKDGYNITNSTKVTDLHVNGDTTKGFPKNLVWSPNGKPFMTLDTERATVADVVGFLNAIDGVEASFDEKNQRFVIKGAEKLSKCTAYDTDPSNSVPLSQILGFSNESGVDISKKGTGVKLDGEDARIKLNGAIFESNTNNFNINGLSINVKETTAKADGSGYDEIKIVTDTDVDGIYNTIKDFFKEYNELINEMDSLYNADRAKDYQPLTDEEKEAMSEKEVEKWEEKIKKSLLRRDTTLSSISSTMKTAMLQSFTINGEKYSLSTFGILTGNYFTTKNNEKNAFHIDGDPDDSTVSSNEDKLKAAIAANPETVADFFSQLTSHLYSELDEKMKGTTLSSAFTVYNDKQITADLRQYNTQISKWENYVSQQEEFWYNKFTAMEKALAQLQSSTSALSGLLGS